LQGGARTGLLACAVPQAWSNAPRNWIPPSFLKYMKTFYSFACTIPRGIYLVSAILLYVLMLGMGSVEPTVDALPGREDFSKIYHVLFFFGLAGLLWFGLRNASVRAVTLLIVAAGAIDELHQYFLPFRHARITDVLIDTVAGLVAALILHQLRRHAGAIAAASRF
jgi:VanZ family protein